MRCERCGASLELAQGAPVRCAYCGHAPSGPAADPRIAALMEDRNQNGIPDVIEKMAARGVAPGAMGGPGLMPLGGGSFRAAPSIDLSHVPPAPRAASPRAKEIIFGYQGSQKVMLIIGVVFMAMGTVFSCIFCWGLPVDIALSLAGRPANGTVVSTEMQSNVRVNGRHPSLIHFKYQLDGRWYEGSSSAMDSALLRRATPGATVPLEVLGGSPEWVRVQGTTYSTFGYIPGFVLLFPLIGFFVLSSAVRSNRREIKAFMRGVPVVARVDYQGPDTSTKMNGRHPHMLRWSFDVRGDTFTGSISHMEPSALMPLVGPEQRLIVLYDPSSPRTNTVYIA